MDAEFDESPEHPDSGRPEQLVQGGNAARNPGDDGRKDVDRVFWKNPQASKYEWRDALQVAGDGGLVLLPCRL
jgi:hypothetical protein